MMLPGRHGPQLERSTTASHQRQRGAGGSQGTGGLSWVVATPAPVDLLVF